MDYKIIRNEETKIHSWSGGISKEIYIYPANSTIDSDFNFRISTATINPGKYNFSDFSGYKRLLILLTGELNLTINNDITHLLPYSHIFFNGDTRVISNTNFESIDFNLIYKENINILNFKFIENNFNGEKEYNSGIHIYYNLESPKHIHLNNNEYTLAVGDTFIACGNNFQIEGVGTGIYINLKI